MRECVFCDRKLGKKKNRKVEYFDGWQHQPMKCSFISDLRRQGAANTAQFTDVILVCHRHVETSHKGITQ